METDHAEFVYVNDLRRLGIALGIYFENIEHDAIWQETARWLEPGPDPQPPQDVIEAASNDVREALLAVPEDKRIRPQTINISGDAPETVVAMRTLEAALVARHHHPTVARWAIYRCVEKGELLAGHIDMSRTVTVNRKRQLLRKEGLPQARPRPEDLTTQTIDVTPEHLRDLFVSLTARSQTSVDPASRQPKSTPSRKIPANAVASSERVTLFEFGKSPVAIVDTIEIKKLRKTQYDVLKALLEAGPDGLNKDELEGNSDRSDARGILTRMTKISDWASVIQLAGEKGCGYRIL